jgi:hypothetical protein
MSTETEPVAADEPFAQAGVQYYLFAGVSGLLAMWALLLERFGIFSMIPLALGSLGMITYAIPPRLTQRWKSLKRPNYGLPLLVLLSVAASIYLLPTSSHGNARTIDIEDALLAGSLLTYLAAQYRLFSLGTAAFPPDSRPTPKAQSGEAPEKRPEGSVRPVELLWLGLTMLVTVVIAFLVWRAAIVDWTVYGPAPANLRPAHTFWRFALLIWLFGIGTLMLTGIFRTLRIYRNNETEARMVLQDALWAETRGEQRRINRWVAWQRRLLRRKEK